MPYAFSIAQIETVKERIHPELVAKAYLLDDSMFEDLGIMVTTDVENIDTLYLFSRQGLQARPYVVGRVKSSQLGKWVDNPAKVEDIYLHTEDSIARYKEKGPFDETNVLESAPHTTFLLNELTGRFAEDVRANVFFGNMANKSLPETAENQVKLGLSLFDGIYTIIAKRRTDGTISAANRNLIATGEMPAAGADQAKQCYEMLVSFYSGLSAAMKKPEQTIYIYAADNFCRLAVKGYMQTYQQLAPTVLQSGWKFAEMPNIVLKTSSAMGSGAQLIATLEKNIEFLCDKREQNALISIGQVNKDLRVFDYQANGRACMRTQSTSTPSFPATTSPTSSPSAAATRRREPWPSPAARRTSTPTATSSPSLPLPPTASSSRAGATALTRTPITTPSPAAWRTLSPCSRRTCSITIGGAAAAWHRLPCRRPLTSRGPAYGTITNTNTNTKLWLAISKTYSPAATAARRTRPVSATTSTWCPSMPTTSRLSA